MCLSVLVTRYQAMNICTCVHHMVGKGVMVELSFISVGSNFRTGTQHTH